MNTDKLGRNSLAEPERRVRHHPVVESTLYSGVLRVRVPRAAGTALCLAGLTYIATVLIGRLRR
jgi:hypothetical protein